jgi:hypothetical protein
MAELKTREEKHSTTIEYATDPETKQQTADIRAVTCCGLQFVVDRRCSIRGRRPGQVLHFVVRQFYWDDEHELRARLEYIGSRGYMGMPVTQLCQFRV